MFSFEGRKHIDDHNISVVVALCAFLRGFFLEITRTLGLVHLLVAFLRTYEKSSTAHQLLVGTRREKFGSILARIHFQ